MTNNMKLEGLRIQKFLSEVGFCSRRKAEKLIIDGKVTVNGRKATIGDKLKNNKDLVAVDGEKIFIDNRKIKIYIALNKPRGYVTTMSDELGRKIVTELLQDVPDRVYPVGRLDKDSEGLLLLTNDGALANALMHPSHSVTKAYRVTVRPSITEEQLIMFSEGIELDGKRTLPIDAKVITQEPGRTVVQMVLQEGRNRQIRRMCEELKLTVARLKRISIGPVRLGMLKSGEWRNLTKEEVASLRRVTKLDEK